MTPTIEESLAQSVAFDINVVRLSLVAQLLKASFPPTEIELFSSFVGSKLRPSDNLAIYQLNFAAFLELSNSSLLNPWEIMKCDRRSD